GARGGVESVGRDAGAGKCAQAGTAARIGAEHRIQQGEATGGPGGEPPADHHARGRIGHACSAVRAGLGFSYHARGHEANAAGEAPALTSAGTGAYLVYSRATALP